MMRSLQAVSFDLWDTLYHDDVETAGLRKAARHTAIHNGLRNAGIDVEAFRLWDALNFANGVANARWKQAWTSTPATERLRYAFNRLNLTVREEVVSSIATLVEDIGIDCPPPLVTGALELVPHLARRYHLAVLSDTGQTPARVLRTWLSRAGLLSWFRTTTFSDEVGQTKPGPAGFQRVLSELGVAPEHAVHVGDNPSTDVAGALNAGMLAVHVGRAPDVEFRAHPRYRFAPSLLHVADIIEGMNNE